MLFISNMFHSKLSNPGRNMYIWKSTDVAVECSVVQSYIVNMILWVEIHFDFIAHHPTSIFKLKFPVICVFTVPQTFALAVKKRQSCPCLPVSICTWDSFETRQSSDSCVLMDW